MHIFTFSVTHLLFVILNVLIFISYRDTKWKYLFYGVLKFFFFAHKKIKIFRVGGKNRVGRVTPIKQFFFLGLTVQIYNEVCDTILHWLVMGKIEFSACGAVLSEKLRI